MTKKSFTSIFFLHQKNTKVTNSTQNYYGCKAVSTSVASLFHLKRHKRFSSISKIKTTSQSPTDVHDGCLGTKTEYKERRLFVHNNGQSKCQPPPLPLWMKKTFCGRSNSRNSIHFSVGGGKYVPLSIIHYIMQCVLYKMNHEWRKKHKVNIYVFVPVEIFSFSPS